MLVPTQSARFAAVGLQRCFVLFMENTSRRFLLSLGLACLALTPMGRAVNLPPDSSAPADPATSEVPGLVLSDKTISLTGSPFLSPNSTLRELVVRRLPDGPGTLLGGGLDFYFQLTNAAQSTGLIEQLFLGETASFEVDVRFDLSPTIGGLVIGPEGGPLAGLMPGTVAPTLFERSSIATGADVAFDFPFGSPGPVAPGQRSKWLVVRSNATDFGPAQVGVTSGPDSSTGPVALGFPTTQTFTLSGPVQTVVPEPGTAIFGAALLFATGAGRLRRKFGHS